MIQLATFFSSLGITGGNTQADNFYEFWKGIIMNGNTEINNITEFMNYLGTNRYEFFKSLNSNYPSIIDETSFYANIDDPRIYDYYTFYKYAGEYFIPITPTPTPTNSPTPSITPTITPTNSPTPSITPTITPTHTPTPTPTYTPYVSPNPVYSNIAEFVLAGTGSTTPSAGQIIFNNANACFNPKTTIMRISYTDRLGADVEAKVKSYTGATGSTVLFTTGYNNTGSPLNPQFTYQTTSFTDYGTYLELVHTVGNGTCGDGYWIIGSIIQLAKYTT
jgi:hypothetical protein